MRITQHHGWNLSITEAIDLQGRLATEVDATSPLPPWNLVAAADVSYNRSSPVLYAAVVVVRTDTGEVVERAGISRESSFPYVPGLLSFREAPPLLAAFEQLKTVPDVVLCDGQGVAHPRRLGIASHLGLCLDLPTIGCAKSRLCGTYDEPGPRRGDRSPLRYYGRTIGCVLRTRDRVRPLFISPGHRCDLEGSVALVLALSKKYRLPEPARLAHEYVNELRRRDMGVGDRAADG